MGLAARGTAGTRLGIRLLVVRPPAYLSGRASLEETAPAGRLRSTVTTTTDIEAALRGVLDPEWC